MIFRIPDPITVGSFVFNGGWALLASVARAGVIALLFWLVSRFLKFSMLPHLVRRTDGTRLRATHILLSGFSTALPMLFWVSGLYLALSMLPWADSFAAALEKVLLILYRILCILLMARGLWNSADLCELLYSGMANRLDAATNLTVQNTLSKLYRALVAIFCVITVLNELDFNVTGLITGVGLAGLTVSLAAQDSASNLFSGLMILLERPFGIGDWIKVGDVEGTVEDLSFRSTKIRALDNSLYVIPNSKVSSATVNNGTNRTKRLFRFTLGVTYGTSRAQLEQLMADLETLLKGRSEVEASSVTVRLTGFGDSSIDILVSCNILTADITLFLQIQNALNLEILDLMGRDGVQFAFPSTSVYLEKVAGR